MEDSLYLWIAVGALVVLAVIAIVWTVAASASMRRLSGSVDERWAALTATLERRQAVATPLLAGATEAQRAQVADAFATLERAQAPGEKAAAEAAVQRALRPLVLAAA